MVEDAHTGSKRIALSVSENRNFKGRFEQVDGNFSTACRDAAAQHVRNVKGRLTIQRTLNQAKSGAFSPSRTKPSPVSPSWTKSGPRMKKGRHCRVAP